MTRAADLSAGETIHRSLRARCAERPTAPSVRRYAGSTALALIPALIPALILTLAVACTDGAAEPGRPDTPEPSRPAAGGTASDAGSETEALQVDADSGASAPSPATEEPASSPAFAESPRPQVIATTAEPAPPVADPADRESEDEAAGLPPRGRRYLELAWRDLQRLDGAIGDMGPHRNAAAALVAAALSNATPAADYTRLALDACTDRWHKVDCERAALDLQRVALQYPDVLPPPLGRRLRREVARPAAAPSAVEIADPWNFPQTENQRAVTMARSLAAAALAPKALAGSTESAAAGAWESYAVAFLAAHDRRGWYEADSPGYLAISVIALLHLHDFAAAPRVRQLAGRQLNLLLADWAAQQAAGMPAGARTRTYAHWALGAANTPWRAWAWLVAGRGDPRPLTFGDWPEIAVSRYRVPAVIGELLGERRASYAVRERRRFELSQRRSVDAALYSWVTPDYVLSASQAVQGLQLAISGGQEIAAWLLPEGSDFAPLYLWSRHSTGRSQRWRSRADQEQAVAHENVLLARLGRRDEPGYAYFAPPWGRPERAADGVLVGRYGGTYVALVGDGGWEVAPAPQRVAGYFAGDKAYRGSWVAVPRRQPAAVALQAAGASEAGSFAAWKERAAGLALSVERNAAGEPVQLAYRSGGTRVVFQPGRRATVDGVPLDARAYPLHDSPFLVRDAEAGTWRFRYGDVDYRFEALPEAATPGGGG